MRWNGQRGQIRSHISFLRLERLEERLTLNAGGLLPEESEPIADASVHGSGCLCGLCGSPAMYGQPPELQGGDSIDGGSGGGTTAGPTAVPAYSSLLSAKATIYLDFDGHFEPTWGSYSNIDTPAYSTDTDTSTFSSSELDNIRTIWQMVSEDYAPFNVNVTTVAPDSFANGVALRVVIGGNGSWTGGTYGGLSYVNSFTNSIVNTAFVYPVNLGNGYPKYVADASSHEAGHAFGLRHQSAYSGTTMTTTYQSGPGDGTAPLMGNSYSAARSLWWYGRTTTSTTYQNDMDVIASTANGFGYRTDDHGGTQGTSTSLTASAGALVSAGVIERMSDVDVFSFVAAAGDASIRVDVEDGYNDLDPVLELRDGQWNLIASANPGASFDASITAALAAGTYYVVVTSSGTSLGSSSTNYGFNVGRYSLSGTLVAGLEQAPAAPGDLTAAATSSSQIGLTWTDNSGNETGFLVERYDGTSWVQVASVGANVTAWQDGGLTAGTSYSYRVRAVNNVGTSPYGNTATATTNASGVVAPSGLTGSAKTKPQQRINLSWADNSTAETGYNVYRSLDGVTWTRIASLGANASSYGDTNVSQGVSYSYRVEAFNSVSNAFSAAITVTMGGGGRSKGLAIGTETQTTPEQGGSNPTAVTPALTTFTAFEEASSTAVAEMTTAPEARPLAYVVQGGEWLAAMARLAEEGDYEPILQTLAGARRVKGGAPFSEDLFG